MARSAIGGTVRFTGSLYITAFAGMVMVGCPPNVSGRPDAFWIAPCLSRSAMCAAAVRLALSEIVVPVGVAAAAGIALAATISPRWRAAGMPYFLGCGKNVES